MTEREQLTNMVIQNPEICEKLLEIVQLLVKQKYPHHPTME